MPKVELVYFGGCPSIEHARQVLRAGGIREFSETNLDSLPADDWRKQLSSPSILVDGKIMVGSENGGAACSFIDWEAATSLIRELKN